ncbi:MAG: hypothetical protein E7330_01070 [Clostridiales bacterium]|nr:hypothetical protein [Clostridiales bacterium]
MDVFFSAHTGGLLQAQAEYARCSGVLSEKLQEVELLSRRLVPMRGLEDCAAQLIKSKAQLEEALFTLGRLHAVLEDALTSYHAAERSIQARCTDGER